MTIYHFCYMLLIAYMLSIACYYFCVPVLDPLPQTPANLANRGLVVGCRRVCRGYSYTGYSRSPGSILQKMPWDMGLKCFFYCNSNQPVAWDMGHGTGLRASRCHQYPRAIHPSIQQPQGPPCLWSQVAGRRVHGMVFNIYISQRIWFLPSFLRVIPTSPTCVSIPVAPKLTVR